MTTRISLTVFGMAFTLIGCGEADGDAIEPPVAVTAVQEWSVDGHKADLVPIASIAASPEGDVYVTQGFDRTVLAFDAEGRARGEVGGQGEGPGEFARIGGMGVLADTLWVYDANLSRLTLFDRGLDVARMETWSGRGITFEGVEFPFSTLEGVTPGGMVHASLEAMPGTDESAMMRHALTDLEGNLERMVVEVPLGPSFAPLQSEGGVFGVRFPFALLPLYEVSGNGRHSALVTTPVDDEARGTIEVVVFDESGEERDRRRVHFEPRAVPEAEADSLIDARAAGLGEQFPDIEGTYRQQAWIPPFIPPVERVMVGRDGSVWLEMSTEEEGVSRYRVLDPDSERVGEVEFPGSVRVAAGDVERVWAVVTDDTGVGSVGQYRVVWDGANADVATDSRTSTSGS